VNKAQLVTITVMLNRVPQAAAQGLGLFHGIHSLAEAVINSPFRESCAETTTCSGAYVDKPWRTKSLTRFGIPDYNPSGRETKKSVSFHVTIIRELA
jgi:hypothetical protein